MRYCPTCRRYVNGAYSCAGCGIDATKLPYVGPDEPLTRRQPVLPALAESVPQREPETVASPAPPERSRRVTATHAVVPLARRPRAGRLAPALLVAGLGFAGLCAVAGSAAPGGSAAAQGSAPLSAPTLGGLGQWGGGQGSPVGGAAAPGLPGGGATPTNAPTGEPGAAGDTVPVAAVAPASTDPAAPTASTVSTTGSSPSLAPLAPVADTSPATAPGTPVTTPTPATPTTTATSTPTTRSGPTPAPAAAPAPTCALQLLVLCLG
ncbi:hypothetical protein ABH931_002426 [Streptacidiphilus sp. MAP12-33]|uniref:hypothetical protein n=1 Tax=Streptacidiphilus sp. MAP12-33 TaxID=3156266 RepID=UPI003512AF85